LSLKWFRSKIKPIEEINTTIEKKELEVDDSPNLSLNVKRSVSSNKVKTANEKLNLLNVERNILSFALTHLYESEAEGKISEDQRNALVEKYSSTMRDIEKNIEETRLIVDLYKFESTQAELLKDFYDRFQEIDSKAEDLRTQLGIGEREEKVKPPKSTVKKKRSSKPKSKSLPKKIEREVKPKKKDAEQKIEAIQEEVIKVLEKLQQMETEA
jgi:hypothetical protein